MLVNMTPEMVEKSTAGLRFYLAPPLPSAGAALNQVMARLRALDD